MTTAPTPSEAERLADALHVFSSRFSTPSPVRGMCNAAIQELRRLQAENARLRGQAACQALQTENERLRMELVAEARAAADQKLRADQLTLQHRMQAQMHEQATQQLAELEARKPLPCIPKLGPSQRGEKCSLGTVGCVVIHDDDERKPLPLPLSDEQIDAIADGMPGGLGGFMKTWGWRQFARKILDLRAPPTWEPQFDAMAPGQEELAVQFCAEIAGPRGQPGSNPDPVRLLEMAEALYKAEADARLVDKSPNLQEPLVDKTANLQDRPTRKPLPPPEDA